MHPILENVLDLINFRKINVDEEPMSYYYFDSMSVRIYLDKKDPYFDFGVYDFGENTYNIIKEVLNSDLLNRKVESITYEEEINMLAIYLEEVEYGGSEGESLQKNYDILKEEKRGFKITEEEDIKIRYWIKEHMADKHQSVSEDDITYGAGAIGGRFTYEFTPTSIGVIGTIKCSCGDSFTFRKLT